MITKQQLEKLKEVLGCFVARPESNLTDCHEYDLCGCTGLRLIEALEVATEAIKEIEAKKDKTLLHECCVNNTCVEVYNEGHRVANCAFQYGVNQGYSDSAGLAQEALDKIYGPT